MAPPMNSTAIISTARALSETFATMRELGINDRRLFDSILRETLAQNPQYLGVWTVWEPNALDGRDRDFANAPGHDRTGRFIPLWLAGVPLGVLCGSYRFFSRLQEPFIEFFRYLPAPAFGALCVAILGITDGPKIAIIFIGTFFQQVLVIANSVRKVDPALIEAAQTLGAKGWKLV